MSASGTSGTSSSSSTSSSSQSTTSRYDQLGIDDFLKLLISELQHQDPTNPMSNQDMMAQISQIQQIESNTKLTKALDSVTQGQAMSTASNLVGKTIIGLPDGESQYYEGVVAYVTIADGKLHVDDKTISLTNVSAILSDQLADAENSNNGTGTGADSAADGSSGT